MSIDNKQHFLLQEMGINPVWIAKESREQNVSETISSNHQIPLLNVKDWEEMQGVVSQCTRCDLAKGRTNTVFGVGDPKAEWLFIGEGPGRNEDLKGEPFVGQAGKLLDNMMLAMGLARGKNAYIANVVKCRPTSSEGKDRPPTMAETEACIGYLLKQIEYINPRIIIALGKTAAMALLNFPPETPVSKLRNVVHQYANKPLIVTYHPAYLLRSPGEKSKAWQDLCFAKEVFDQKV